MYIPIHKDLQTHTDTSAATFGQSLTIRGWGCSLIWISHNGDISLQEEVVGRIRSVWHGCLSGTPWHTHIWLHMNCHTRVEYHKKIWQNVHLIVHQKRTSKRVSRTNTHIQQTHFLSLFRARFKQKMSMCVCVFFFFQHVMHNMKEGVYVVHTHSRFVWTNRITINCAFWPWMDAFMTIIYIFRLDEHAGSIARNGTKTRARRLFLMADQFLLLHFHERV